MLAQSEQFVNRSGPGRSQNFRAAPLTSVAIAACACVSTAFFLGATWLGHPVLGLPVGAWAIAGAVTAGTLARRAGRHTPGAHPASFVPSASLAPSASVSPAPTPTSHAGPTQLAAPAFIATPSPAPIDPHPLPPLRETTSPTWPTDPLLSAVFHAGSRAAARLTAPLNDQEDSALAGVAGRIAAAVPTRPLRVGAALAPVDAERLREHLPADTELAALDPAEITDSRLTLRQHCLDALITRNADHTLTIDTPTSRRRDAAWFDWNAPRPISYAALFPFRVDTARVGHVAWPGCAREAALLADAARLAALLGRLAPRLALADHLHGRHTPSERVIHAAFDRLASHLHAGESAEPTAALGNTARLAGRVLSAAAAGPALELELASRRRLVEIAARSAGHEPEVMLRLAAVRLSCYADTLGLDALERADRMLRDCAALPGADPLAYVQSEIELAPFGMMTFGRVAAGIALACLTADADRVKYLRDDLLDDMKFSHWLIGRDQDRALLTEVFRCLERTRRREQFALPLPIARAAPATVPAVPQPTERSAARKRARPAA